MLEKGAKVAGWVILGISMILLGFWMYGISYHLEQSGILLEEIKEKLIHASEETDRNEKKIDLLIEKMEDEENE